MTLGEIGIILAISAFGYVGAWRTNRLRDVFLVSMGTLVAVMWMFVVFTIT